jgi:hypothetical protein
MEFFPQYITILMAKICMLVAFRLTEENHVITYMNGLGACIVLKYKGIKFKIPANGLFEGRNNLETFYDPALYNLNEDCTIIRFKFYQNLFF